MTRRRQAHGDVPAGDWRTDNRTPPGRVAVEGRSTSRFGSAAHVELLLPVSTLAAASGAAGTAATPTVIAVATTAANAAVTVREGLFHELLTVVGSVSRGAKRSAVRVEGPREVG